MEVLSLSISKISSLRPFGRCGALRELYLRKNSVADLAGLCFLARLPNLQARVRAERASSPARAPKRHLQG